MRVHAGFYGYNSGTGPVDEYDFEFDGSSVPFTPDTDDAENDKGNSATAVQRNRFSDDGQNDVNAKDKHNSHHQAQKTTATPTSTGSSGSGTRLQLTVDYTRELDHRPDRPCVAYN